MMQTDKKDNLIGQAENFLEVLERVSLIASINKPVLIIGERGTGKELIAERIHYLSTRWDANYVKLNCATLASSVLESELFGHELGAFTGANKRHQGRFERANGGTLFLDELANTPLNVQEKLLNVIEYGEFERVGGNVPIKAEVRLICATNQDLPTLVSQALFRADLLDRLAFDVITLPPLRSRSEDILLLAENFAINMAKQLNLEYFGGFTEQAKQTLLTYTWPGNIRELKNVIERSLYRHNKAQSPLQQIILDPFESPYRPSHSTKNSAAPVAINTKEHQQLAPNIECSSTPLLPVDLKLVTHNVEVNLIKKALISAKYSQKQTAKLLGLTYHQLRGLLKKHQLLEPNRLDH